MLAALDVQQAVQGYATELLEREGIVLSLRAGVHTGEVIVAPRQGSRADGGAQYWDVSAMGGARALAVRTDAADPFGVWVSEDTYRLVAPLFEWERVGERRSTTRASCLPPVGASWAPGKGRGIEGLDSPLVGRAAELRALQDVWRACGMAWAAS